MYRWSCIACSLFLVACAGPAPVLITGTTPVAARASLPPPSEADWPTFRDDVERTGFAEGSVVGDRVALAWELPAFNVTDYGAVKGSPSVVGDLLYCGTDNGRFVALHAHDGSLVWEARIDRTSHGIHGSPAIVGDVVYIGAYDGSLYAFDCFDGRMLWRHARGYQVGSSPAVLPSLGLVLSAHEEKNGTGHVLALDARTGETRWEQPTEGHPHSSVAADPKRGRVFVGDNSGRLYAFDARTGEALFTHVVEPVRGRSQIKTTPSVLEDLGLVVFGSWTGEIYALSEETGALAWHHRVGGSLMGSTAYLPATETLFVGSPRGTIHAIDARDGKALWSRYMGAPITSSPAVSGDGRALVFGSTDGYLHALDPKTGRERWSYHLEGQLSGSPTLVGSRIYVTAEGGALSALETR